MKRLTINHIARANLKQNRRAYLSMAIGIFMAVFLAATLCLSVQSVMARRAKDKAEKFGLMDMFTVNHNNMTDEELVETGFFRPEIGHVYVTARVPDTSVAIGYYDETAIPLLNRRLLEGRMPEAPGEVAVEQSAIDRLRMEAAVGDTLTLTVTPSDGLPEERSYTIVGLLNEQSTYLDISTMSEFGSGIGLWPSILTCPEEPGFTTGNVSIHRLLTLRPTVSKYQAMSAFSWDGPYDMQMMWTVTEMYKGTGPTMDAYDVSPAYRLAYLTEDITILLICLLGVALLIAVCAGISGAMESQLAHKTEEIGMLRAVGATKRQIRRIFGRESWLLVLVVSPAAILLALLFTWIMSRIAPHWLLFRPSPWVLLPVLLLVTATILVSSSLPLRRASHIMPMSILRDTAILRKARRIKSRKQFKVPALVARRQLTLHPTRLIGSVVLVSMMLFMAFFGTMVAGVDVTAYMANYPAFVLSGGDNVTYRYLYHAFADLIPTEALLSSDLQQIAALPMVTRVLPQRELFVCFEADVLSEYYTFPLGMAHDMNLHLTDEAFQSLYTEQEESWREKMIAEGYARYVEPVDDEELSRLAQLDHRAAQKALGTSKPLVIMPLTVFPIDVQELEPFVASGKIDIDAINAGREVIVYAPDYVIRHDPYNPDVPDSFIVTAGYEGDGIIASIPNDVLLDGMTLPIAQFYETNPKRLWRGEQTQEAQELFYENTNLRRATVSIGAVIKQVRHAQIGYFFYDTCIITTDEGLRNMGLNYEKATSVNIYLSGTPDEETEQWLEGRIASIASRGGMNVRNNLAYRREQAAQNRSVLIVLICIAVIFFAAAAGMICGNVSRQLRADSRMIGTLRAVGADDRALSGCYSGSIYISVGLGLVVTLLIVSLLMSTGFFGRPDQANYLWAFISCVALAAAMLGCCLLVLRLRVKDVIHKSIVENIKEL